MKRNQTPLLITGIILGLTFLLASDFIPGTNELINNIYSYSFLSILFAGNIAYAGYLISKSKKKKWLYLSISLNVLLIAILVCLVYVSFIFLESEGKWIGI